MKTILSLLTAIVLLTLFTLGCGGYGSGSGSGSMAAGAPNVANPLVPNTATAGSAAFTLTVNGSGFVNGSVIYWNSTARTTRFMTSGQLITSISRCRHRHCRQCARLCKEPGRNGNL